ncbi:hypothetical protein OG897_38885 [Streptomyces sp. NBC_00237]|uniref:hypothetical protein n=1 Tax=Streptomyces sp. NBC_00237 TaxID=2975687 RepID=UPI002259340E|nr:hypothetical protein [Streptomyces sp. NBC_00237]MCX5207355.1 hypothetical protein [Streptomyces sp. NBC_00237]
MTRAVLPALLTNGADTGTGSVVHVASEAACFLGSPIVDAAAKTALLSVSPSLAAEFGSQGSGPTSSFPARPVPFSLTPRAASPSSSRSGSGCRSRRPSITSYER